ncbi:MAG: hypothetical protein ACF8XB_01380 [Planctomycetota bacterium JB042]
MTPWSPRTSAGRPEPANGEDEEARAERELREAWRALRSDAAECVDDLRATGAVHAERLGLRLRNALLAAAGAAVVALAIAAVAVFSAVEILRGVSLALVRWTGEAWVGPLAAGALGWAAVAAAFLLWRRRADQKLAARLEERLAEQEAADAAGAER